MRIVIYGLGAVGGVIGAALVGAGHNVLGIARGGMLHALQQAPLRMRSASGLSEALLSVAAHPDDIDWQPDDLILLTMKTQDTTPALNALRAAGVRDQAIFCFQNGISNEDMALRRFPNVHGVTVMMPATYLTPGEVIANGTPMLGLFDIGRYPHGVSQAAQDLVEVLDSAQMRGFLRDDVMASKRGKLLLNLTNGLEAALGAGVDSGPFGKAARDEGKAVFRAAGLGWEDVGMKDPRRKELMQMAKLDDVPRSGGSTSQSLQRGTGAVETDWLNGEIVRLGGLHGVPTPINAFLGLVSAQLAHKNAAPGSLSLQKLKDWYASFSPASA